MGLSQTELSDRLGLTFQQVQKYERGDNRISASRLVDIARVLKIPISFFFDDMPDDVKNRAPGSVKDHPARAEDAEANLMGRRETLDLVRAYYQIIDSEVRKRVYDLARLLGK